MLLQMEAKKNSGRRRWVDAKGREKVQGLWSNS